MVPALLIELELVVTSWSQDTHTLTHTQGHFRVDLMCMSLDCGRKPPACELERKTPPSSKWSLSTPRCGEVLSRSCIFFDLWPPVLFWKITLILFQVVCSSLMCHLSDHLLWLFPPVPHYLSCGYTGCVSTCPAPECFHLVWIWFFPPFYSLLI